MIYKVESSIASKKRSKNVEVVSAPKAPSSAKNRSPIEKEKGKILEHEVDGLEWQLDKESNLNETLHSQEKEDLEKKSWSTCGGNTCK